MKCRVDWETLTPLEEFRTVTAQPLSWGHLNECLTVTWSPQKLLWIPLKHSPSSQWSQWLLHRVLWNSGGGGLFHDGGALWLPHNEEFFHLTLFSCPAKHSGSWKTCLQLLVSRIELHLHINVNFSFPWSSHTPNFLWMQLLCKASKAHTLFYLEPAKSGFPVWKVTLVIWASGVPGL